MSQSCLEVLVDFQWSQMISSSSRLEVESLSSLFVWAGPMTCSVQQPVVWPWSLRAPKGLASSIWKVPVFRWRTLGWKITPKERLSHPDVLSNLPSWGPGHPTWPSRAITCMSEFRQDPKNHEKYWTAVFESTKFWGNTAFLIFPIRTSLSYLMRNNNDDDNNKLILLWSSIEQSGKNKDFGIKSPWVGMPTLWLG